MLDGHGQLHNIEPRLLDINILSNYFYDGILKHKKNVVNIFTKALSIDKHEHFPCLMGMVNCITLNQGC
jgi:hypothetical protein